MHGAFRRGAHRDPGPAKVTRPRVYGNEVRFKSTLGRHIAEGDDLLDLAKGVLRRTTVPAGTRIGLLAYAARADWCRKVERWRLNAIAAAERHLADKAEAVLPELTAAWPPDTGKPRHERRIESVEPWLREALSELRNLREALGVSRNVAAVAAPPGRFDELRASGLVDVAIIDGVVKDVVNPRTAKQLADAIGAAKELTEATLRSALDRSGVGWSKNDGLPQLMRKWRDIVNATAPPDPAGKDMLDRAQAALANVVAFLGEWRNEYGRGHGRAKYPAGLRARHARLAADAAETAVRFIVMTMDDLSRLPP